MILVLDPMEVSVHLLDMKMFLNKIYILVGAANASHAPQMYYSIGNLEFVGILH